MHRVCVYCKKSAGLNDNITNCRVCVNISHSDCVPDHFKKSQASFVEWLCQSCVMKLLAPLPDDGDNSLPDFIMHTEGIDSLITEMNKLRLKAGTMQEKMKEFQEWLMKATIRLAFYKFHLNKAKKNMNEDDIELIYLHKTVANLRSYINLEFQEVMIHELEISGLVETPNENLKMALMAISRYVNADIVEDDVQHVDRVEHCDDEPRIVVVRFFSIQKRNFFYACCLGMAPIYTRDMPELAGIENAKIRVHERLTREHRGHIKKCRDRCKQAGCFYWMKKGEFFVRKPVTEQIFQIADVDELDDVLGPVPASNDGDASD